MILFICMHPTFAFYVCRLLQSMESVIELYIAMQLYMRRVKGKAVRNRMLWSISQKYITDRIGCSQAAGAFLLAKRLYCVKNAICCDEYAPITKQQEMKSRTQYQAKISLLLEM